MFKEEILENERRREIYRFIEKSPGVHLRHIERSLKMPHSSLEYHLNYMVRRKIVSREKNGRYKRYFVRPLGFDDKRILSALRQKRMREIVLRVLLNRKARYQVLLNALRIPSSTLSLYLKYLVDRNILKRHRIGRENVYTVQDEDRVAKVLISYKSSFVDRLVDKVLNTWMETRFRESRKDNVVEIQEVKVNALTLPRSRNSTQLLSGFCSLASPQIFMGQEEAAQVCCCGVTVTYA